MDKIKTKRTVKGIKTLDKAADVTRNAKNAYIRTKEQSEQTRQTGNENYVEYAGNKVKEGTWTVVKKVGRIAQVQWKKAVRKIKEGRTANRDSFRPESSDGYTNWQSPKNETRGTAGQKAPTSVQSEPGKRRFIQKAKQTGRFKGKAVKETEKGTIKTSRKTIKTAHSTAKTTIKTSQTAAKTAARATQTTVRATRRAIQAVRMAAITARAIVKAVVAAVKAAIAAIKGLIAIIAAGGWVVIVIILIFCLVAFLIKSPFGIFFSGENKDANVTPITSVVQEVNSDFTSRIERIKTEHTDVDSVMIDYPGSVDNIRINNWMDVVAVFAVKTTMNSENAMDVASIDTARIDFLKSVFWDMNLIDYAVETQERTEIVTIRNDDGTTRKETVTTYEDILHITVTSKTAGQQANDYGFTNDQKEIMEEMLSGEFRPIMFALLGLDSNVGLTPDQLQNLYNNLPSGQFGAEIVRLALSRLGDPYSQSNAGQDDYTDCSYLTQWCYQQVGIFLPRTAAEQAEYCVDNGLTISPNDLEPGDLIFFSLDDNGRFMNISHVAIYAGNGYIVDASSSRGQVVYRELFGGQVLYAKP